MAAPTTMTVPHWADLLALRPEVTASDGSVGELQMSLHKAVYQTVDVPYRKVELLRRHHRADPEPDRLLRPGRPPAGHHRGRHRAVPPRPGHGRRKEPRPGRPLPHGQRTRRSSSPPTSAVRCRPRPSPAGRQSTSPAPRLSRSPPTTSRRASRPRPSGPATTCSSGSCGRCPAATGPLPPLRRRRARTRQHPAAGPDRRRPAGAHPARRAHGLRPSCSPTAAHRHDAQREGVPQRADGRLRRRAAGRVRRRDDPLRPRRARLPLQGRRTSATTSPSGWCATAPPSR